ncbi:hypothetical protein [Nocardioides sp. YIM 152315]|uniref:hypothetical protein n=1 Tax=Nocardioides sp. YIM 152315 TaxID=3031760 RepID=UPI0023DCAB92|nr:hypothetical protein [Nocardioides sp. YIM 152315]MDF1604127.1 hypothetical protein [Nocardioides sp. YIM 152315]
MTTHPPPYVVHHVEEGDVTVDWFFGRRRFRDKFVQLVLVLLGWVFVVLPVVITASALLHRGDADTGWWGYHEGFVMWDVTVIILGILTGFFIVGFLALHLVDRVAATRRDRRKTYDEERLAERLEVAADWYAGKFGPEALRLQQRRVEIEPYGDIETYELRNLHRRFGVG